MRKPYLAGNWKMNLDRDGAVALARALAEHVGDRADVDVALVPPFVYLLDVKRELADSRIRLGAQNMCSEPAGAFTGEISGAMLLDVGAELVVLGHSERRHVFGETDQLVNAKVLAALAVGLDVILCLGETLEERQAGRTEEVVRRQLLAGLAGVARDLAGRVTLAYEPVWAIGTGHNATPAQAGDVHRHLRSVLADLFDEDAGARTRIQYGGSVKPDNVAALMAVEDVDGALVGGASLTADSFIPIIDFDR